MVRLSPIHTARAHASIKYDGHLRTLNESELKCRKTQAAGECTVLFSAFLACSQISGVFYHSIIHGLGKPGGRGFELAGSLRSCNSDAEDNAVRRLKKDFIFSPRILRYSKLIFFCLLVSKPS